MKNTDTHKVVLPTGDISGKANASAFDQIMNLLIRILTKLGLLREDLDYHVVRASMVIIYFFFGYQKWFDYEAQTLIPFISNGPLISWMYPVFGIQATVVASSNFRDSSSPYAAWLKSTTPISA
jgi:uncharacterized membrane protein YkgB